MSNQQLLKQSAQIFDSLEKWNALFEIHSLSDQINELWMEKGAEALRSDFGARPSAGWKCKDWEAKRETIWFLSDLGCDSISLVYAWPTWEFHLIFKAPAPFDETEAKRLLKRDQFQPLVAMFDPDEVPSKGGKYRPLASDSKFNPLGGSSEKFSRQRELAWYAAHETDRFVKEMSNHVRQITDDSTLTALVRELNHRAKLPPNG